MKLLRQSAWFTIEQSSVMLSQLVLSAWLIRELGLSGFGEWTLAVALLNLCSLVSLGLGSALIRHLSQEASLAGRRAWLRAGVVSFVAGGLLLAALVGGSIAMQSDACSLNGADCPVSTGWTHELFALLVSGFPALPLTVALQQFDALLVAALRAEQRYGWLARTEVASQVLWLLGLGLMATTTGEAANLILLLPALVLPRALLHLWLLARLGLSPVTLEPIEMSKLRQLLSFAKWQWLKAAGNVLYLVADRLLIGSVLGTATLAVYAVCQQLAAPLIRAVGLLLQPLFPWMSRQTDPVAALRRHWRHFVMLEIAILLLGVLYMPMAALILPWWLGSEAVDYTSEVAFAVLGSTLFALHIAPQSLQMGLGENRVVAIVTLTGAVLTMLLMAWVIEDGLTAIMLARCAQGIFLFASWPTLWRLARQK